jgi:hypothetical protein
LGSVSFTCGTRWMRAHEPYGFLSRVSVSVTLAPFATAFVDTTTKFTKPPWGADLLDARWHITPAQGSECDVVSTAPSYEGAYGVELGFAMTRLSVGVYAVAGTAESEVESGHVELWGYPPGRTHAIRLAVVPVRDGAWSISRFRPSRTGRWEFYARYRAAGPRERCLGLRHGRPHPLRPTRAEPEADPVFGVDLPRGVCAKRPCEEIREGRSPARGRGAGPPRSGDHEAFVAFGQLLELPAVKHPLDRGGGDGVRAVAVLP